MIPKKLNFVSLITSPLLGIIIATIPLPVVSSPLIGTPNVLNDLPFPGGNTGDPIRINPLYADTTGSFTGTWGVTAALAWQGTFTGTPNRIITATNPVDINILDFSGLPNGVLPINTFFALGDLDQGSVSDEIITLRAWDAANTLITTPWLDEPTFQSGTNSPQLASMLPDFMWDNATGIYTFDGNGETFSGNPSTIVFMFNNTPILRLEVDDQTPFAGFGISAPPSVTVPEPAVDWLLGLALIGLIGIKKAPKLSTRSA